MHVQMHLHINQECDPLACVLYPCHIQVGGCRYDVPLVADIHFQPVVANMVAECFEKIRVNPGNFVDGRKRFDEKVYDDDSQFKQEQEHIREVRKSSSRKSLVLT